MKSSEALSGAAHQAAALGNLPVGSSSPPPQTSALDYSTRLIRENPWYAAAAALGLGILLTLLFPKP